MEVNKEEKPLVCLVGGRGKMGRWFTRFFEDRGSSVSVVDQDNYSDLNYWVAQADIVVVSVPISQSIKVIEDLKDSLSDNALPDFATPFLIPQKTA